MVRGMHPEGRRKCRHCKAFFQPEPRNRHHQRYCGRAECRRASKAASQRKWERQPENRDYYGGPEKAEKVRAWRAAHPGYWKRARESSVALPDILIAQAAEVKVYVTSEGESSLRRRGCVTRCLDEARPVAGGTYRTLHRSSVTRGHRGRGEPAGSSWAGPAGPNRP